LRRGVGQFSFEYPASYAVGKVEVRPDFGYTDMTLLRRSIEGQEEDFSMITVFVFDTDEYTPNVEVAAQNLLSQVSKWPDFRLLEPMSTTTATIDSIPARQFAFSNSRATRPDNIISEIRRTIYFEHDGLIWKIGHQSDAATVETDRADFEHILKTFKVLK